MRTTTLQPAGQWAQEEFAFANLGDHRLSKRLVNVATNLAANPGGTLPQAFADWAELKAAYRFFDNRSVDFERVVQPHLERTRLACREPGEYLMIEDSSTLDFSGHRRTQDLGVIGDGRGRGFELHRSIGVAHCVAGGRGGAFAEHKDAGAQSAGGSRGQGEFWQRGAGYFGKQIRPAQRRLDQPERAGGNGTAGRISGAQARRNARLADNLAWLATSDVDV
jgi:Transposase DNA-binding